MTSQLGRASRLVTGLLTAALVAAAGVVLTPAGTPDSLLGGLVRDQRVALDMGGDAVVVESRVLSDGQAWLGAPLPLQVATPDSPRGTWVRTTYGFRKPSNWIYEVSQIRDGALLTLGWSLGKGAVIFAEPRIDVPADLRDGATWGGQTQLLNAKREPIRGKEFRYEAHARAEGECWRITREESIGGGEPLRWATVRCPGRGIVAWGFGDALYEEESADAASKRRGRIVDVDRPEASVPAATGVSTLGAPRTSNLALAPVHVAGQRWVHGSAMELRFFDEDPDGDVLDVFVLPGGTISTIMAARGVVVVTTTRREVVAYDADGVWLWTTALDDAAMVAPVLVGDTLVVATLSGDVVGLDPRDGSIRWQADAGAPVQVPLAAEGELVLVGTTGATVKALDAAGVERWSADVPGQVRGLALHDGIAAIAGGQGLAAIDAASGEELWRRVRAARAIAFAGDVIVFSEDGLRGARDARTGEARWVRDGECTALVGDGESLVCLLRGQPGLVGDDGEFHPVEPVQGRIVAVAMGPGRLAGLDGVNMLHVWGAT